MIQLLMPGSGALLLLVFASAVVVALLVLLQLTRLGFLVRSTIPDRPRRRMFLASVSFVITFVGVRLMVMLILRNHGPVWMGDGQGSSHPSPGVGHPHPAAGGLRVAAGPGAVAPPTSILFSRLMSVSYGVGAALTLDEFALWLDLEPDAYWTRQGRLSVRRGDPVWGSAGNGRRGARRFSAGCTGFGHTQPVPARGGARLDLAYSARAVASSA